jgi:hypothetical protein
MSPSIRTAILEVTHTLVVKVVARGSRGGARSSLDAPVTTITAPVISSPQPTRPRRITFVDNLPQWLSISSKRVESVALDECNSSPSIVEDLEEEGEGPRLLRSASCTELPRSRSGLFRRGSSESSEGEVETAMPALGLVDNYASAAQTEQSVEQTVLASYDPSRLGHFLNPPNVKKKGWKRNSTDGLERGRVSFLSDCEIKVEVPFVIGGFPNTLYDGARRSVDTLPLYVGGSDGEEAVEPQ